MSVEYHINIYIHVNHIDIAMCRADLFRYGEKSHSVQIKLYIKKSTRRSNTIGSSCAPPYIEPNLHRMTLFSIGCEIRKSYIYTSVS